MCCSRRESVCAVPHSGRRAIRAGVGGSACPAECSNCLATVHREVQGAVLSFVDIAGRSGTTTAASGFPGRRPDDHPCL